MGVPLGCVLVEGRVSCYQRDASSQWVFDGDKRVAWGGLAGWRQCTRGCEPGRSCDAGHHDVPC